MRSPRPQWELLGTVPTLGSVAVKHVLDVLSEFGFDSCRREIKTTEHSSKWKLVSTQTIQHNRTLKPHFLKWIDRGARLQQWRLPVLVCGWPCDEQPSDGRLMACQAEKKLPMAGLIGPRCFTATERQAAFFGPFLLFKFTFVFTSDLLLRFLLGQDDFMFFRPEGTAPWRDSLDPWSPAFKLWSMPWAVYVLEAAKPLPPLWGSFLSRLLLFDCFKCT